MGASSLDPRSTAKIARLPIFLPLVERDIAFEEHVKVQELGDSGPEVVAISQRSVTREDLPIQKGFHRVEMSGGWLIKRKDTGRSEVTRLFSVDMKIPKLAKVWKTEEFLYQRVIDEITEGELSLIELFKTGENGASNGNELAAVPPADLDLSAKLRVVINTINNMDDIARYEKLVSLAVKFNAESRAELCNIIVAGVRRSIAEGDPRVLAVVLILVKFELVGDWLWMSFLERRYSVPFSRVESRFNMTGAGWVVMGVTCSLLVMHSMEEE